MGIFPLYFNCNDKKRKTEGDNMLCGLGEVLNTQYSIFVQHSSENNNNTAQGKLSQVKWKVNIVLCKDVATDEIWD